MMIKRLAGLMVLGAMAAAAAAAQTSNIVKTSLGPAEADRIVRNSRRMRLLFATRSAIMYLTARLRSRRSAWAVR
ncbi:MAG: hypothetical protein ABI539_09015 [Acidobacteriota bacterium]